MARPKSNEWDLWEQSASYDAPDRESPGFLEPIFGNQPFTPQTTCKDIHPGGRIPKGSACCCMACHKSGKDHLRLKGDAIGSKLNEDWSDDTDAETKPTKYEPPAKGTKLTRKQKRAAKFAPTEAA